jgi:hypothetical protein
MEVGATNMIQFTTQCSTVQYSTIELSVCRYWDRVQPRHLSVRQRP